MAKIDYKKEYKALYTAPNEPALVDVPSLSYLMIDGQGDPNTAPLYSESVGTLYKLAYAIRFLMRELGLRPEQLLFAGDSGNDLPVLASEIPAVLVANASDEVREAAEWAAHEAGHDDRLYPARGLSDDLNGNYAAGIIEGLVHYHPRMAEAVRRHLAHLQTSGS